MGVTPTSRTLPRRRNVILTAAGGIIAALLSTAATDATAHTATPPDPAMTSRATATTAATFPGVNGRIAYTKRWVVSGNQGTDIFTVRPNGDGNKRLTFSHNASNPKWSPTGGRIAFERGGAAWVMKADGSGKAKLTDGELVGWMPTGGRVLVVRDLGSNPYEEQNPTWWLHDISTGTEEQLPIELPLVEDLDPPYAGYDEWSFAAEPTLSPDGELLALTLRRNDNADSGYDYYFGSFFTVRLDGSGLTRIPKYDYSFGSPSWSPDGSELVYWTSEPRAFCGYSYLRSIRLDGTQGAVDISRGCDEVDPAWSPDGKKITYTVANGRLMLAKLNGTGIKVVLPDKPNVHRSEPDWRSVG